ncbi:MAG TPA: dihydrolipoamide acetyltransferase family protein [Capsulimonadaceae bacterium]|nr:dihydrolipoamide acetyltransferase family protein [Capsulimonadaceae bacterium]
MPEVIMPKMGDAMESGTVLAWRKKSGDSVSAGDVIAEIETDKSNIELEAEDAGVFQAKVSEGANVPVGAVIATIGEAAANGQNASEAAKPAPAAQAGNGQKSAPAAQPVSPMPAAQATAPRPVSIAPQPGDRVIASPLAKRIARENGLDIAQVKGTGPNGRIIEADIKSLLAAGPAKAAKSPVAAPAVPAQGETRELSQIRRVIARRMAESKGPIPHFYVTSEIDMGEAMALREKLNSYDDSLSKISLNDMVVKASARALVKFPEVNSVYQGDKVVTYGAAHVGIAVALDDGLIVPVVRNADTLPLRQLAASSRELIQKARDKKLQPGEYQGGTFTVSNLGSFDVENFIAIIDPSQGAILAVSTIVKKPVVLDNDSIVVRQRMNVTLSGDHRVMDGATGAKFMQELKRLLQNPLSLLEQ